MYNLKNEECQKKFTEVTSKPECHLSDIFEDDNEDLNKSTKKFMKRLDDIIKICFKKVRIKEKINKEVEELFKRKKIT